MKYSDFLVLVLQEYERLMRINGAAFLCLCADNIVSSNVGADNITEHRHKFGVYVNNLLVKKELPLRVKYGVWNVAVDGMPASLKRYSEKRDRCRIMCDLIRYHKSKGN